MHVSSMSGLNGIFFASLLRRSELNITFSHYRPSRPTFGMAGYFWFGPQDIFIIFVYNIIYLHYCFEKNENKLFPGV